MKKSSDIVFPRARKLVTHKRKLITRRAAFASALAAPAVVGMGHNSRATYCPNAASSGAQSPPSWAVAAGMTTLFLTDNFLNPDTIDLTGALAPNGVLNWWNTSGNASQITTGPGGLTLAWNNSTGGCQLQTVNNANNGHYAQYWAAEAVIAWTPVNDSWAQWWSFCREHNLGTDSGQGMELDIFESGGSSSNSSLTSGLTTLHTTAPGAPCLNCSSNGVSASVNPQNFNKYGALWTQGQVNWYINDAQWNSFTYGGSEPFWDGANNHLFWILAVQGWGGNPNPSYTMTVQSVNIWIA